MLLNFGTAGKKDREFGYPLHVGKGYTRCIDEGQTSPAFAAQGKAQALERLAGLKRHAENRRIAGQLFLAADAVRPGAVNTHWYAQGKTEADGDLDESGGLAAPGGPDKGESAPFAGLHGGKRCLRDSAGQ